MVGQRFGKGCTVGGVGLLVVAFLGWVGTVLTSAPLGLLTVLAVPPGVVLLAVGSLTLGYGSVAKVIGGLLLVGVAMGVAILYPVLEALNLLPVVAVFAVVVVALAWMATMNSQEQRRTGSLSIDDSKGYDGQSEEREWIPSDQEMAERER